MFGIRGFPWSGFLLNDAIALLGAVSETITEFATTWAPKGAALEETDCDQELDAKAFGVAP